LREPGQLNPTNARLGLRATPHPPRWGAPDGGEEQIRQAAQVRILLGRQSRQVASGGAEIRTAECGLDFAHPGPATASPRASEWRSAWTLLVPRRAAQMLAIALAESGDRKLERDVDGAALDLVDDESIRALVERFRVSGQAMVFRLTSLGLLKAAWSACPQGHRANTRVETLR
jgi:hypothetical protein